MITSEWFGVATFRLTIGDLVIFLDAYMDRVPAAPPVGLRSEDVDSCDYVLVGHSHFDHLHGAQHIAKNTGAKARAEASAYRRTGGSMSSDSGGTRYASAIVPNSRP